MSVRAKAITDRRRSTLKAVSQMDHRKPNLKAKMKHDVMTDAATLAELYQTILNTAQAQVMLRGERIHFRARYSELVWCSRFVAHLRRVPL